MNTSFTLPTVGSGGIAYSVVREIVVRTVVVLLSLGDVGVEDFVVRAKVVVVGTIADSSSFFFVSTTISTTQRMINRTTATPTAANILNFFDLEQNKIKNSKYFANDVKRS